MAIIVKHTFQSAKVDGPDPTVVRPSNWNDAHELTGHGWMIAGTVFDYLGHSVPSYFLEAYGQSVAAAAYPALFAALIKQATVTLTLGSPGTVNWVDHGLPVGSKVRFRTTGALPTGLTANTDYYIVSVGYTSASFRVSATIGGTALDFTGSQSGVHTGINAQFGVSNDLTTFTIPDLRGRVTAGLDSMGGVAAGRLTLAGSGIEGAVMGSVGGAETHVLTAPQLAAHQHNNNPPDPTINFSGLTVTVNSGGSHTHVITVDPAGGHTHANTFAVTGISIGSGGAHTHTHNLDVGGTTDGESNDHTHSGTTGLVSNDHAHNVGLPIWGSASGAGSHHVLQPSYEGGTVGTFNQGSGGISANHNHAFSTGGRSAGHTHSLAAATITGGILSTGSDHSHTVSGGSLTGSITAVADHTHVATAAAGGAHTHTTTVGGTITSALADFLSDAAGGGLAHNNTQPTFVLRKVVYIG